MTETELQDFKKEATSLVEKIEDATAHLVKNRLDHDTYRARNAELRLLALTNEVEQLLTALIERI